MANTLASRNLNSTTLNKAKTKRIPEGINKTHPILFNRYWKRNKFFDDNFKEVLAL
jgi:hypothetical protein